jgi:hypothetical protein
MSNFDTRYENLLKMIRSIGTKPYDALRDIGDNAYDAGASELRIWTIEKKQSAEQIRNNGKKLETIVIADNGRGMTKFETLKSLVPAETGRERVLSTELGFFGIGLLASGFSIADTIKVYTRSAEGCWFTTVNYLEKMNNPNPVNVVRACTEEEIRTIVNPYLRKSETGTVIVLEDITRLEATRNIVDDLNDKIAVSFARGYYYMQDEISVYVNNVKMNYYDTLERGYNNHLSKEHVIHITEDKYGNKIDEKIYVQMSCIKKATNPTRTHPKLQSPSQQTQGWSLVRNNRELSHAQKFNMWTASQPTNNFRGVIRYNGEHLDGHIFDVNISKTQASIISKKVWSEIDKLRLEYFKNEVEPRYEQIREQNRQIRETKAVIASAKPKIARTVVKKVSPIVARLNEIDMDNVTPKQAVEHLNQLKMLALAEG